jgi:hypothetical protein
MATYNPLEAEILERGADDWVYLAEVVGIVRSHTGLHDPEQVKQRAIQVVEELLNKGYVRAGDLFGSGSEVRFQPWELSPRAAVAEIERRWLKYGGPIGKDGANDVCWLLNTPEGDELAKLCQEKDDQRHHDEQ